MSKLNFMSFDKSYEDGRIILFGAPFDGTTSFRPGTRFGPQAARIDSEGIETYSPYLDRDLEDFDLSDIGDLDFPFGNSKLVLDKIEKTAREIYADGKIPFMIGGEHLVSYGTIRAAFDKFEDMYLIHFDAHADLRADYCGEPFSHATVIRRAWDFIGDNKIFQFGIRSGTKEEFEFAKKHTVINPFDLNGIKEMKEIVKDRPVYITIDLDVLDPSVFPGTGTPEPGGIGFKELLNGIHELKELNIIGADVVELSPHYDHSGISNAVCCKIVRELALTILYK